MKKETDADSSASINDEILDDNNTSEEISPHQNSAEVIDHTCDDNGINLFNTEEEADLTSINFINATNYVSMNGDDNFIYKYYAPFYHQRIMKMYLLYQNMIRQNNFFFVIRTLFWIYY